jgi:hypothetical protein
MRRYLVVGIIAASCVPVCASNTMDNLMLNATNVAKCYRDAAFHFRDKLHQISVLGDDAAASLVENSCDLEASGYMHFCEEAHRSEDQCIGDLKVIAVDALQHPGN